MNESRSDRLDLAFTGITSFLRVPICTDLKALDADIAIIGAPSDEGTPWIPGMRFAPRAIREVSLVFPTIAADQAGYFDFNEGRHYLGRELAERRIVDCGDVDVVHTNREQTFDNITHDVQAILDRGAMPVIIGGDHGVTFPVVRAYRNNLHVIHFDAHLDYRPFEHGIRYSNGTPIRSLSNLHHVGKIVQVGIRSIRERESDLRASLERGNAVVTVEQMRERGVESVFSSVPPGDSIYVSIDIDVLDMPLIPGCSSAEVEGFSYKELRDALAYLAGRWPVVGFDLVEVNPMLDVPAKNTSRIAAQLIQEFLGHIVLNPHWRDQHPEKAMPGDA